MDRIKEFIESFIESEYDCNRNEYLSSVTDEEFDLLKNKALKFYHSRDSGSLFVRGIAEENLQYFTEEEIKAFEKNSIAAIPRTLFQIKYYQGPILGDALKRIVTGSDLYACYVGYTSEGGRDLYFSSIFYVSETNEGLKIIYRKSFDSDTGVWYHPVDLSVGTVIDEGKLIEVEKYQEPEEVTSLADYNAE
ncbi:hypothetical protein [Flavobacterium sp. UBA4197]|uniref:hypothetical protein n=1 Tax=Flavobacterium sp. UBA4197 TaxID=1946546 RepID=UPI00257A417B|nr:hypothetical protein [Flavobacterium sp. UBA4197]